jgi:uncharacterized protein YndB with AHSA1/START domain
MEPIEIEFTVSCSPAHAFYVWANKTSMWWPTGHSMSGDPDLVVTFEPAVGGRIFERTPSGAEHQWGEIIVWDPPTRLAYLWHLAVDRSDATDVEITFDPDPDGTRVRIVHSGWERLGSRARERRHRNLGGWAGLLPHYQEQFGARR